MITGIRTGTVRSIPFGREVGYMHSSVYLWSLRPEEGLYVELRIVASSALVARRELRRFLAEHDGTGWKVESVTRENDRRARPYCELPDSSHVH